MLDGWRWRWRGLCWRFQRWRIARRISRREFFPPAGKTSWAPTTFTPGSSAFWLDPDLFWPVEDPHRDMCWTLLDKRPGAQNRAPAIRPGQVWLIPSGRRGLINSTIAGLAQANAAEDRGDRAAAQRMRARTTRALRAAVRR